MSNQEIISFVLDCPNEAAEDLAKLRAKNAELQAALQAYVDEAKSHTDQGKPGTPFAERLAAAEAALK